MKPEIIIYDDDAAFFKELIEKWVDKKQTPFRNTRIVVTTNPFKTLPVLYDSIGNTFNISFSLSTIGKLHLIDQHTERNIIDML